MDYLNKPLIEIVNEYLADSKDPREHEILSGVFIDNRASKREEMEREIEYLRDESNELSYEHERLAREYQDYYCSNRMRAIKTLRKQIEELRLITLEDIEQKYSPDRWSNPLKIRSQSMYLLYSDQYFGFRKTQEDTFADWREGELILHKAIIAYLKKANISSSRIEYIISRRRAFWDYYRATKEILLKRISEETSFAGLRSKIKHFVRSTARNEYFEALFSLAKTKEEIFFVVKHAQRCPCWPGAVRKLAEIKDLSPIEKSND